MHGHNFNSYFKINCFLLIEFEINKRYLQILQTTTTTGVDMKVNSTTIYKLNNLQAFSISFLIS